jgi:hypothetical protein
MAQNTSPIFTLKPEIQWASNATNPFITSAVLGATTTAAYDGTSGAYLVFSGNATNGSFLQKLILEPGPGNNGTAAVLRVFINNGLTTATASNNALVMSYSLPTTTASATAQASHIEVPLNIQIPPGYRVYTVLSSSALLTGGWAIIGVGGDY